MELQVEDFIGEWRDSMGNEVHVEWAKAGNRGGQLDVQLMKPRGRGDPIRLNVKHHGGQRFTCGHYDLRGSDSDERRIVWEDHRNQSKTSIWDRVSDLPPRHDRALYDGPPGDLSSGPSAARTGPLRPLRESHYDLPPRSSMSQETTPGAWKPPGAAPSNAGPEPGRAPPDNIYGAMHGAPPGAPPHWPPPPMWHHPVPGPMYQPQPDWLGVPPHWQPPPFGWPGGPPPAGPADEYSYSDSSEEPEAKKKAKRARVEP